MPWQILITIHVIALALYVVGQRIALRDGKYNITSYAIATLYLAGLSSLFIGLARGTLDFGYFELPLQISAITLFFNSIQMVVIAMAMRHSEVGTYTLITNTRVLIMVPLAAIFLGDSISALAVIGMFVILIGAILAVYEKGQKIKFDKGLIYTLLATITIAIPFVSDTYLLQDGFDPSSYLFFVWTIPAIIVTIFKFKDATKLAAYLKSKDFMVKAFVPSALLAVAINALLMAFQQANNPSILAIISQTASVVAVLLGVILLKERKHIAQKLIATALAFSGLVLINF
jgi:drug/metabolite transporter (DMT)-like permease